jgi:transcriptional regulator with XRE-family HTH domain
MSTIVNEGEILKVFLTKNRISKTGLAKKMGVSRTTIHNWLDLAIIPRETLKLVGQKLGVDFFEIIKNEIDKEDHFENTIYLNALKKKPADNPINFIEVTIQLDGSKEKLEMAVNQLISLNNALRS